MTIASHPAIDDTSDRSHPGKQQDPTEDGPARAGVHQGPGHGDVRRGPRPVGADPLDRRVAFLRRETPCVEFERLPGHDLGVTLQTSFDESGAPHAEGAVTVDDQKGTIHTVSVPADRPVDTCQADGVRPITG